MNRIIAPSDPSEIGPVPPSAGGRSSDEAMNS